MPPRTWPRLAVGPYVALTAAPTAGVRLFARRPPAHSVILGPCQLDLGGAVKNTSALAIPASTPHEITAFHGSHAAVAYLDARYYRFADAQHLAQCWRGFSPERDDLCEALGDALRVPRRRADPRLLRALDALDADEGTVTSAARAAGLSASRLTHLMTETLGASPRALCIWLKLRRALGECLFGGANLTQAAHRAGFADSAHLTRTCKQLMGVRPAQMMPRHVRVAPTANHTVRQGPLRP